MALSRGEKGTIFGEVWVPAGFCGSSKKREISSGLDALFEAELGEVGIN